MIVGFAAVTVTVTDIDFLTPLAVVAVITYVVVCVGTNVREPDIGNCEPSSSSPSVGAILTDTASVVVHVNVVNWPAATDIGFAAKVATI